MKKLFGKRSSKDIATAAAPATPAAAATLSFSADTLAHAVANKLFEPQKRGFAGLCACALPDVTDGSTQLQWSKAYLTIVVNSFLDLDAAALASFLPMLTARQEDALQGYNSADHTKLLDPAPYLELFIPTDTSSVADPEPGPSAWNSLFGGSPAQSEASKAAKEPEGSSPWNSLFGGPSAQPEAPSTAADNQSASVEETKNFRLDVMKELLWFTVKGIGYDARARTLFRRLAQVMNIPWRDITAVEGEIGRALFAEATTMPLEKFSQKLNLRDWKRNAVIGAAAVTGGALLAVTGGLAAPAIAGSLLALGEAGAVVGAAVGTASGVTATSVLFGAAGAGVVGKKTDTRTRGVQEFQFDLLSSGDGMNVYICISGWLDKDDPPATKGFRRPWGDSREYLSAFYRVKSPEKLDQVDQILARYNGREDEFFKTLRETYDIQNGSPDNDPLGMRDVSLTMPAATGETGGGDEAMKKNKSMLKLSNLIDPVESEKLRAWRWKDRFPQGDQYTIVWEEKLLRDFGDEMRSFALSYAKEKLVSHAGNEILRLGKYTALAALFSAVALPKTILGMADMIDNIWVLAMNAADKAGKILAQTLLDREQGLRPVTLVGYGIGARMIISCLKELGKKPDGAGAGIIENAILLGASVPVDKDDWKSARQIVSGRLVNGFSENDWMLAIMYRYEGWALNCAGITRIEVDGVENIDLTDVISGHFEYKDKVATILDLLKLEE